MRLAKREVQEAGVNPRERLQVRNGGIFIDLVRRAVQEPAFNHWAQVLDEARVRSAT